jgi:hypothetical protein
MQIYEKYQYDPRKISKNFSKKNSRKIRNLTIPLGSENAECTRCPETDPNGIDPAWLISCHFSVRMNPRKTAGK